ncbi:MAG: glycosyltransferase [Planctomycetota bacterium]
MRILLIADNDMARREFAMLRRLELDLLGQGVSVALAIPERSWHVAEQEPDTTLAPPVRYRLRGGPITRPLRCAALNDRVLAAESIGSSPSADGRELDVVHVFGSGCWAIASDLSVRTGAVLFAEVFSPELAMRAVRVERRRSVLRGRWLAPSTAMLDRLHTLPVRWPCHACPWGVHPVDAQRSTDEATAHDTGPTSIAVLTAAESTGELDALLAGLADLSRAHEVMLFVSESVFSNDRRPWRRARELGLISVLSLIPDIEQRRDVILACDLAIICEHHGVHRTIALDAMAAGTPLLAQRDPAVGWFVDHESCLVLESPRAGDWTRTIAQLIDQPSDARALGQRAREYARRHHLRSAHVERLMSLYTAALESTRTIPFRAGA